jgi:hypothetical protein
MYNLRMGSKGGIGDEAYAGKVRLKDREPLSMREQEGKKSIQDWGKMKWPVMIR